MNYKELAVELARTAATTIRIDPESELAVTEDDLVNAIFYNTPLDAHFTGSKLQARTIARAMLRALMDEPDYADAYPIHDPGCNVVPYAPQDEPDWDSVPF